MANVSPGNVGKLRFDPSDHLIAMFRACSRDATEPIKTRLKSMLHVFLQHYRDKEGNEMTKEGAAKCCRGAVIWYHKILEKFFSQDSRRDIFETDRFQGCLVAFCLEINVTSYSPPCNFPLLLRIFNLASYDFWTVIGLLLQVGVDRPHSVFRHLGQVEESILESLAWTSDSPLWEEIRANEANEGHLPTCQQVILRTQPEVSDVSLRVDLSASTDQQCSPSAGNEPQRSSFLHLFAHKVYILMGKRLMELCATLDISDELRFKIWTCFEHSLVHCTDLIVDRHLDQLLACAICIIAKVCKNGLISGRAMENLLFGPNNNGDHRSSNLTPNTPSTHYPGPCQDERGNLIYFYNHIYSTKMQHFAEQFAPTFEGDTPPQSPYPRQWEASPRRRRLCSSSFIYISPLNKETTSPRLSGLCYTFNSSSPERLREMNNMIKTGKLCNKRSSVAISLDREDEDEQGEDGPTAKRLCLDAQSALQRRLRSVVNDRAAMRNQDQV